MLRTFDLILIVAMIVAAAVTYTIKHGAEKQLADIRQLERRISAEKDTLILLKADWSLLTQPSRLQKLAHIYEAQLNLQPVDGRQFVHASELPVRPANVAPDPMDPETSVAEILAGQDSIKTGSVRTSTHQPTRQAIVIPAVRPARAGQ
ncbi:MAG: cell division protein FtsL [Phyllobacterium sp.]